MTNFCGHKTGFNKAGKNKTDPNPMGPPATKFKGRGGVPEGSLKHYPGAVAATSMSNRRVAKSAHGDGDGSGTRFCGNTAFNRGSK